jgi:hypothetical protein
MSEQQIEDKDYYIIEEINGILYYVDPDTNEIIDIVPDEDENLYLTKENIKFSELDRYTGYGTLQNIFTGCYNENISINDLFQTPSYDKILEQVDYKLRLDCFNIFQMFEKNNIRKTNKEVQIEFCFPACNYIKNIPNTKIYFTNTKLILFSSKLFYLLNNGTSLKDAKNTIKKDIKSLNEKIDYFDVLRYCLLLNKEKSLRNIFIKDKDPKDESKYFKNYIEFFNLNRIKKIEPYKRIIPDKDKLTKLLPEIFQSGYARKICQLKIQPKLLNEIELKEHLKKNPEQDYMRFPYNSDNYFICNYDKEKYAGLKINKTLENKSKYPLLPCCFSISQKNRNTYRDQYENLKSSEQLKLKDELKTTTELYKPVKLNTIYSQDNKKRYAYLPDDIDLLFKLSDNNLFINDYQYLRVSVNKSKSSSLLCLIEAFSKGINKIDYSENTIKKKIKEMVIDNCATNTLFDKNSIIDIIDNNKFLDAKKLLPIYEKIFNCKIIIFCLNIDLFVNGSLCSEFYKSKIILNHMDKFNYDQNVIFLFESTGGEMDAYEYPQYELICKVIVNESVKLNKIINYYFNYKKDNSLIQSILNSYYSIYPVENIDLSFKTKIISQQSDDYNGYIRQLFFDNGLTCLIDPIPSFNIKRNDNITLLDIFNLNKNIKADINKHTFDNVINFLNYENLTDFIELFKLNDINYGIIVKISFNNNSSFSSKFIHLYFPICNNNTKLNLSQFKIFNYKLNDTIAPTNIVCNNVYNNYSYLQNYIFLEQLSRILLSHCFYLISLLIKDNLFVFQNDFNKLFNDLNKKFIIDSSFYNIHFKFDLNKQDQFNFNRELNLNSILFTKDKSTLDTKIIVPNKECKTRLIYQIFIELNKNYFYILNYYKYNYIPNFYKDIRDFSFSNKFMLLNNSSLQLLYDYKKFDYIIHYKFSTDPVFFYQNDKLFNNKLVLIVRHNILEKAILCNYNWLNYRMITTKNINNNSLYNNLYKDMKLKDKLIDDYNIFYIIFDDDKIADINNNEIIFNDKILSNNDNNLFVGILKEESNSYEYFEDDYIDKNINDNNNIDSVNYLSIIIINNINHFKL